MQAVKPEKTVPRNKVQNPRHFHFVSLLSNCHTIHVLHIPALPKYRNGGYLKWVNVIDKVWIDRTNESLVFWKFFRTSLLSSNYLRRFISAPPHQVFLLHAKHSFWFMRRTLKRNVGKVGIIILLRSVKSLIYSGTLLTLRNLKRYFTT